MEALKTEVVKAISSDGSFSDIVTAVSKSIEDEAKPNGPVVEKLQQHCRDLEIQLENVKVQIVKILSEKRACSQENCFLKKRICDLRNQLPDSGIELDDSSADSGSGNSANGKQPYAVNTSSKMIDKAISTSDDLTFNTKTNQQINLQDESKTLETNKAGEIEISALKSRCEDLEKSLSLMRDEYERCEDYWAGKLDEERHLAEQEQRITDEKFSELMSKIREYEELFAEDHMRRSSKAMDGRLETIDEQDGLEKQVCAVLI